jgi:drug/metabolite transporter (DMT)-like permease
VPSFNPVANVTAFRECVVLFGALIGVTVLRERFSARKLFAWPNFGWAGRNRSDEIT